MRKKVNLNLKTRIRRVEFNPSLIWQIAIFAFLALVVLIFVLNVHLLIKEKKEIEYRNKKGPLNEKIKIIDETLLKKVVSLTKKRRENFQEYFSREPAIKDPSI
jgi:hypothetical protein